MSDKHEDIEGLLRLAGPRDTMPKKRTERVKRHGLGAYWP